MGWMLSSREVKLFWPMWGSLWSEEHWLTRGHNYSNPGCSTPALGRCPTPWRAPVVTAQSLLKDNTARETEKHAAKASLPPPTETQAALQGNISTLSETWWYTSGLRRDGLSNCCCWKTRRKKRRSMKKTREKKENYHRDIWQVKVAGMAGGRSCRGQKGQSSKVRLEEEFNEGPVQRLTVPASTNTYEFIGLEIKTLFP